MVFSSQHLGKGGVFIEVRGIIRQLHPTATGSGWEDRRVRLSSCADGDAPPGMCRGHRILQYRPGLLPRAYARLDDACAQLGLSGSSRTPQRCWGTLVTYRFLIRKPSNGQKPALGFLTAKPLSG